ncbi:TetR/AcrR family transcriptional regulator [Nocardia sp. NPDC046473]|uniref:TetR/AcrR family transcriptional regulator n=1 Tax=Nocardia sp. NPDC046473 TaxID=3155733 RepID=UPI0033EB958E
MSTPMGPWGPLTLATPQTPDRTNDRREQILDAARELFVRQGLSATSMAQLAAAAGISRVWLYRHFDNRDTVMNALITREAHRILAGLERIPWPEDPIQGCVDYIAYGMDFLRHNELLQPLLRSEPALVLPFLTTEAGSLFRTVTDWVTNQLAHWSGLPTDKRTQVAEILTRITFSATLTPSVIIDFDDPAIRTTVIRALVAGLINEI